MVSSSPADELARSVAGTVDAAAGSRVIVLGSLPPSGRDLDLVADAPARERIARALGAAGLVRKGSDFALFRACSAYGVELFAAEDFAAPAAIAELFAQALPLSGFRSLARPAPSHALLILAGLVAQEGGLQPKRQARLQRILAEDPHAWRDARRAAPSWDATRALALLERVSAPGASVPVSQRLRTRGRAALPAPRRRRLLVALSGIDGSGKSSQARWLADSLTALGTDAEVVWNNLLGNHVLNFVAAAPKALLGLAGGAGEPIARYEETPSSPDGSAGAGAVRGVWSTVVTFSNAVEQRIEARRSAGRHRVVIFDRSPLDLAVRMHVLYRGDIDKQRRLVRLLAPRPDLAFLLDIPAEVSLRRKSDIWSPSQLEEQTALYRSLAPRFAVRRLDGQLPPDEIAAEIAREAWLALR